jgi:hypothetical protein
MFVLDLRITRFPPTNARHPRTLYTTAGPVALNSAQDFCEAYMARSVLQTAMPNVTVA